MKNVSRIASVLSNTPMHVLLWRCLGGCMWSRTGLSGRNKKNPKHLSRNSSCTRACCCVLHAKTREGLSVPLEFFLHLNLPQKVSYGSYHMLILCERAPINMHVCINPPSSTHVCVCACLRKPRSACGTSQAGCFDSVRETITVASKVRRPNQKAQIHVCVWIRDVGSLMLTSFLPKRVPAIVKSLAITMISETGHPEGHAVRSPTL